MIELRHLRYFIAVAEELSFTRAAERLRIAQPPLSVQIRQLEDETGVALFERGSRPLRLTEAGELLLKRARLLTAEVGATLDDVRRIGRGQTGRLSVAFVGSAMYTTLPDILNAFREAHPDVELTLDEMLAAEIAESIRERRVDVGFSRPALSEGDEFEQRVFLEERLVLAIPERHRFADRAQVSIVELAGEPLIVYRAVCDRGDHHRRTIRRHGWSARGNAASPGRPGLCVSGPRSRFHFHFFERGCEPCTEQRYGDLSHGLCSDRPTTLDVAQHIPCICNVAGGRFGAQARPMGRMVGVCSQRHRIHRLYLHRPAISPRSHPTNHTTLVRLRVTSGFGGFASRRDCNSKLSNWPDGKRRAGCVPGHLHQHYAHSASPRWRSFHGSRVGERRSRSCRIWLGFAHLASRRSATWIRCSPHLRARRFRRLECRCLCNTSPPGSCLITSPGRGVCVMPASALDAG
jgi:DNA-binding transcriptional LysR family regulator